MSKRKTLSVTLCGIIAALSVVVLFFTGLIPVATLALPAVAGILLIPVVAELGIPWGFGVYAVAAVLAFFLTPDREAALFYVMFFGYYPVLFGVLAKIRSTPVRVAAKLGIFNAAVVGETLLSVYVLGIPWESISVLGAWTAPVLLLAANGVFLLYDKALGGLIVLYFQRFHGQVSRLLQGK